MKNYITREEIAYEIKNAMDEWDGGISYTRDIAIDEALKNIVPRFVRPVIRGKWISPTYINGKSYDIYHCSVCEEIPCGIDKYTNFCPNCGAEITETEIETEQEEQDGR